MNDFQLSRNLGTMFESASKTLHRGIDTSTVALPPSMTAFINTNYYNVETTFTSEEITKALNSNNEKEIYAVLKYIISMATTQQSNENDILPFFPFVIKNVNSSNFKIRRLVYTFLLKFNHLQQDIALLSINAIQRSLVDKNCVNRSLAIRCLSGIKIPAILPILLLSLEKSIKDSSPLVRSASAIAIANCVNLDSTYNSNGLTQRQYIKNSMQIPSSIISQLYSYLDILLSDNDAKVLSVSFQVFHSTFNGFLDIFHNKIQNLINHLEDLDSFSISGFLDLMTDYSKIYFESFNDDKSTPLILQSLYDHFQSFIYCPDANVIISLIRFIINIMPFKDFPIENMVLKFINLSDDSIKVLFLNEIEYLLLLEKFHVEDYQLSQFYPLSKDPLQVFKSKINILFQLVNQGNFDEIFQQIKQSIDSSPIEFKLIILKKLNSLILSKSLKQEQLESIISFFMVKLKSNFEDDLLINEYITGLRQLIQSDIQSNIKILINLIGKLFNGPQLSNNARGSIIWLIGEFVLINSNSGVTGVENSDENIIKSLIKFIPSICSFLVKGFPNERDYQVKIQILTCIGKILINNINNDRDGYMETIKSNNFFKLWNYVLELSKLDMNLDLRDQARFLGSILPNVVYTEVSYSSKDWEINELIDLNFEQLTEQLGGIDIGLLMYQINKNTLTLPKNLLLVGGSSSNENSIIFKFNEATKDVLDDGYAMYYDNLRSNGFELKDYNRFAKGISSDMFNEKTIRPSQRQREYQRNSSNSIDLDLNNNDVNSGRFKSNKVNQYKLQSLDDFLSNNE